MGRIVLLSEVLKPEGRQGVLEIPIYPAVCPVPPLHKSKLHPHAPEMQQQSTDLEFTKHKLWIHCSIADITVLLSYHKRDVEGRLR